jgi:hypothetical protein
MAPFSQLLLTSCLFPLNDTASSGSGWGLLDLIVSSRIASPLVVVCDPLQGLATTLTQQGPLLSSSVETHSLASLSQAAASEYFAVELWMTFFSSSSETQAPILTLGQSNETVFSPSGDYCAGFDFEVSTYQSHLLIRLRDDFGACKALFVVTVDLQPQQLTHVLIAFAPYSLSVYINGQAIHQDLQIDLVNPWTSWRSNSVLQLLGNHFRRQPFYGQLAQVAMYNESLTLQVVQTLYQQGIHRSEPLLLQAITDATGAAMIDQDSVQTPLSIALQAQNRSTLNFRISAQVLSLPTYGTLVHRQLTRNKTVALSVPMDLKIPLNETTIHLEYRLHSADYFNLPSTNAYNQPLQKNVESFAYRLIARDAMDRVIAYSTVNYTQSIQVIHVNHVPTLTGPTEIALNAMNGNATFINNIHLEDDQDVNIDRVRVELWANAGYLALNRLYRPWADFDSCRSRYFSPWQCEGNNNGQEEGDRYMSFIAIPGDVDRILENLQYQAMTRKEDEITIRVYDGQDDQCLTDKEHRQYTNAFGQNVATRHRGCKMVELKIRIPARIQLENEDDTHDDGSDKDNRNNDDSSDSSTPKQGFSFADALFWSLLVATIMGCVCCVRNFPRCLVRGSKIQIMDFGENETSTHDNDEHVIVSAEMASDENGWTDIDLEGNVQQHINHVYRTVFE